VISCHLGGSSSVTGIRDGVAIGTSMGLSPQSGLPQNNRVGDLDSAAVPFVHENLGLSLADVERQMTRRAACSALSGVATICATSAPPPRRATPARSSRSTTTSNRSATGSGAFWIELGGCDGLVFTGGIGENNP
jgi:acetate kinase